jgi:hypothetical protein
MLTVHFTIVSQKTAALAEESIRIHRSEAPAPRRPVNSTRDRTIE